MRGARRRAPVTRRTTHDRQTTAPAPTPVTWPAHDPATYRVVPAASSPLDPDARAEPARRGVGALRGADPGLRRPPRPRARLAAARRAVVVPALGPLPRRDHQRVKGAWLTDVDGRRVLDLSMGFGAMLVGHLNPAVVAAVGKALETGTLFVTPSPSATEAAERFQRRFGLDQLRFANSGTEATMYALRTARAFTGPQGDHQDRGRLPRRLRRAAGVGEARRRRRRARGGADAR